MMILKRYDRLPGTLLGVLFCGLFLSGTAELYSQGLTRWVRVGSLNNWYSEFGGEIEHGNQPVQQYGLQWPAQYQYQDMQAAKGFWIGTTNFTDAQGITYPHKVVHVGPRVNGGGEFFPVQFDAYAKFEPPRVFVDGNPSFRDLEELGGISDTLKADRVLVNVVNTAIGLTMTRKIHAFSQQHHDNYHVFEYTFTNTGNANDDAAIEYTGKTLTGLYFYWQTRYSVCREVRYMVNNSAGWGLNTMNDSRGPWYPPDPNNPNDPTDLKAQFSWHGYHQDANKPASPGDFDNLGAPIWNPGLSAGYIPADDTTWRLGGAQFVGSVHLHADTSPSDTSDDPAQPATTGFIGSDEPRTSNNSQFNTATMTDEYTRLMAAGHVDRHAWLVRPDGKFWLQDSPSNIGVGAPGGWSSSYGYGPYTLGPGESVTIVVAEGANGLTREEAVRIGRQYRNGSISTDAKNDSVFLGRDRLFETFRRARANYATGFGVPQPPYPPAVFNVDGGGNQISLSWTANPQESANGFLGYRVYRATGRSDSTYRLIFQAGGTAPSDPSVQHSSSVVYSFDDVSAIRGVDYYYYISAFGDPSANTGAGMTPAGSLESSRFHTQTYSPANLKRPPGRPVERARDAIDVTSVLVDGANTIEFEYASSEGGRADGFQITEFYLKVAKWKNDTTATGADTAYVTGTDSVGTAMGVLPLSFYQSPVGSRQAFTLNVSLTPDTTGFYSAYYQVKGIDILSQDMVKMYINGTNVALPSTIVTPYKTRMEAIRIVPNPYIISSSSNVLRFPDQPDRIAFFNIPGNCSIKIYTELGELIREIDHTNGTGDEYWNSITSSNQVVVSGVYIVVFEDRDTGDRIIKKLVIIR